MSEPIAVPIDGPIARQVFEANANAYTVEVCLTDKGPIILLDPLKIPFYMVEDAQNGEFER